MTGSSLPDEAYLVTLSGLPGLGPIRLARLLAHHPPAEAFAVVLGDRLPAAPVAAMMTPELRARWRQAARHRDPARDWQRCVDLGVRVAASGDPRYPGPLSIDPEPPAVLFWQGDTEVLGARRVGIVGTRHPTRSGVDTAYELGRGLADAGVCVVSGLALGIDAAAHRGALHAQGSPAGVIGCGHDWVYPAAHRGIWEQLAARGVLIGEWPPGTRPDAFRFPLRNRILAALCEVLVVVESRESGGSLTTARAALDRDIPVMAVPGSPRVRAAAGTNQLLCDGAAPVTDTADVLVALGLETRRMGSSPTDGRPRPGGRTGAVLARCERGSCTIEDLVEDLDLPISTVALEVAHLEHAGWVRELGGWIEVIGPFAGARAFRSDQGTSG